MDFERRLALHDEGVAVLARDLASRTDWVVNAEAPGFPSAPAKAGRPPDVLCERGQHTPPLCIEVELPETLVRRDTVRHLLRLVDREALDTRLVLIADASRHADDIRAAERLLRCAGIQIPVAAISPDSDTLTGADW